MKTSKFTTVFTSTSKFPAIYLSLKRKKVPKSSEYLKGWKWCYKLHKKWLKKLNKEQGKRLTWLTRMNLKNMKALLIQNLIIKNLKTPWIHNSGVCLVNIFSRFLRWWLKHRNRAMYCSTTRKFRNILVDLEPLIIFEKERITTCKSHNTFLNQQLNDDAESIRNICPSL